MNYGMLRACSYMQPGVKYYGDLTVLTEVCDESVVVFL